MPRGPIRILHVVFSLEPGGMENGLVNVAARLPAGEFEVHVCCLERAGRFAERLPDNVRVHVLDKQPGVSFTTVRRLARLIGQLQPHLLHPHNLGPLLYSAAAALGGIRCPILHGEHSELTLREKTPKLMFLRHAAYRACRRTHTVSHSLRRHLVELGFPAEKIEVVVNGVDTARFQPAPRAQARARLGLPPDGALLGIVGRFGAFKRHDVLLRAFEQLTAVQPAARLLIVGGGGPEEERIKKQVQSSPAAARIHLAGFQPQPENFYQAMDLLVVPSVNEGLSNALLEAMACGVPVLSHTACGNAEVIHSDENGWIADLETPEKLAAELAGRLAAPPQLIAAERRAREIVQRDYSITKMVDDYARLYRALAR
ncbi:MAG: glycosyltransferase [Verrucomicrobia bacterium]|nr:glycosyltransferase [Verrucomicrobiota bacterium]